MFEHRLHISSLIFVSVFLFGTISLGAQTACFNTPLAGTWINKKAATKDLIKIRIEHQCTQEETKDGLIVPGSRWYVKAWTKCYPANCVWGRVRAVIGPEGYLRSSMSTYAADRFLKMKIEGTMINVQVIVNYHDPRRKDRDENVRLTRK